MDASPATHPTSDVPSSSSATTSGPQIRSRITVVCAECKRLKLKCDRRNPCGSCTKRDTLSRCVYSPAAAEKVDLHSLNNRLMQVEAALEKITSGQFHSSYPPVSGVPPPPVPPLLPASTAPGHHHHHHLHAPPLRPGEGLMVSMREVAEVWVGELDVDVDAGEREIKLEPGQGELEMPIRSSPAKRARQAPVQSGIVLPPLSIYYPLPPIAPPGSSSASSAAFPASPATSSYTFPSTSTSSAPQITPELLRRLPDLQEAVRLLDACSDVLRVRPVPLLGGWTGFEARCMEVLRKGKRRGEKDREREKEKKRDMHFSSPSTSSTDDDDDESSLPLFASLCAALSLGATASPSTHQIQSASPEFLYSLSQQALGVWDTHRAAHLTTGEYTPREERERVDYLIACLMGVEGMVLRGRGKRGKEVGEVVGKMVNVARAMGMSDISCAGPGKKGGEMDEVKRMLWWDMVFYDLFISDIQAQAPLIAPLSSFNDSDDHQDDDHQNMNISASDDAIVERERQKMTYFNVRCRLTQLARTIKYRIANPDCCCGYTLDQAVSLSSQIHKFLLSLPKSLRFSPPTPMSPPEPSQEDYDINPDEMGEKIAQAQAAELCILAQVLTLRVYAPFLRPTTGVAASAVGGGNGAPGSASQACVSAASNILRAARTLQNAIKNPYRGVVNPTTIDFYPLDHTVFVACVVCAHAGLTGKAVSFDVGVMEDVVAGLGMLDMLWMGEDEGGSERRCVVEVLKRRMEKRGVNVSVLKRKHDQLGGEPPPPQPSTANTFDFPTPPSYAEPAPLVQQLTGSGVGTAKDTTKKEKDKNRKSGRTGYPSVGYRVRPGKDPLSMRHRAQAAAPPLMTNTPRNGSSLATEVTFNHHPRQERASPPQPQSQSQAQAQAQAMAYRSRSNSVNQLVPGTPIEPPPVDYPMPYGEIVPPSRRYSVHDVPQQTQQQQQQQSFASTPVFEQRQGSFDATRVYDQHPSLEQGGGYGASPYQTTTASGSSAGSPYSSAGGTAAGGGGASGGTAVTGHPSTPTFPSAPTNTSPPTFGPPGSPSSYFISGGYDSGYNDGSGITMGPPGQMSLGALPMGPPPQQQQMENGMITSVPSTPIYEKGQPMYDMKPAMDSLQQHHQQQQQHMMPPPGGYGEHPHQHAMGPAPSQAWPPPQQQQPMDVSNSGYWSPAADYSKYYP